MTKREICRANKCAAEARLHATAEWQEAERLTKEMDVLYEAGCKAEAKKLYWKVKKLEKEARSKCK